MKENQRLEWKQTWRDKFIRGICGFANAKGGVLHIGRSNRGTVVGLPDAEISVDLLEYAHIVLLVGAATPSSRFGGRTRRVRRVSIG